MVSSLVNEIAGIERTNNTIDAHVECSASRMAQDNHDLSLIVKSFYEEQLFQPKNIHVRKIMNGMVIDERIIENVVTLYDRGLQCMETFIQQRYIDRSVNVTDPLLAIPRFKLSQPFPLNQNQNSKNRKGADLSIARTIKLADDAIKNIVSLSFFRVSISQ